MNKINEPKVYLIGETKINTSGLDMYLSDIGAHEWTTDAPSDSEMLSEVYGRMCYMSFKPGLNPNVTKIRTGNKPYLENILKSGHGSVLEHGYLNFIFKDVSRVLCMELIRHRVGTSISQESMRYVRKTDISAYIPKCFSEGSENSDVMTLFCEKVEEMEKLQNDLSKLLKMDEMENFSEKKELTSAIRRLLPEGVCTTIGWGCNFRTLRHVIELRTSPHAEEEIRVLFIKVYDIVKDRYPNIFQDFETVDTNDGLVWIKRKTT